MQNQDVTIYDFNPFLDFDDEIDTWEHRKLPHWSQKGTMVFITFRLGDSLPQQILKEYKAKKEAYIKSHPKPWDKQTAYEYHRLFSAKMDHYLDRGYGECILKRPEIRKILSDTINFRDHKQYELQGYVLMPNHVHILALEFEEHTLIPVVSQIMKYTSRLINPIIKQKGSIWMAEPFDRSIRDEVHFSNTIKYIINNPRFLKPGEYELGGYQVEARHK